jgi:hypothetical protein
MQPSWAQEPNPISTLALRRNNRAMCSCSLVRMPPLNRQTSMAPSSNASMSRTLPSITQGQKTMSKASATSRIFSSIPRTAISQPPHEAAQ